MADAVHYMRYTATEVSIWFQKVFTPWKSILLLDFCPGSILVDGDINGVHAEEAPDFDIVFLTVSSNSADGLRLAREVLFLSLGEEGRQEYGVVGDSQVRPASTFVHDI